MYVYVKPDLSVNVEELNSSNVVVHLFNDGKRFKIIKHPIKEMVGQDCHMSMLKHVISGAKC